MGDDEPQRPRRSLPSVFWTTPPSAPPPPQHTRARSPTHCLAGPASLFACARGLVQCGALSVDPPSTLGFDPILSASSLRVSSLLTEREGAAFALTPFTSPSRSNPFFNSPLNTCAAAAAAAPADCRPPVPRRLAAAETRGAAGQWTKTSFLLHRHLQIQSGSPFMLR